MNARASKRPDLQLEHTSADEHTDVLAQVATLRARGQTALADQIERAYRLSLAGGLSTHRTQSPPSRPRTQRRKRR
jgi:hypothetical protein